MFFAPKIYFFAFPSHKHTLWLPGRLFADAVFAIYQEGDVVWVQDYHLMLLPALLKKQHPKMKVHCVLRV